LRVLAGDPPVDWTKSVKEIEAVKKQNPRDEHFVKVVEKEVFAKGRKALIIMGGGHLYRHSWNPYSGEDAGTAIDLLDHQHPKAVFVIMVHAFQTRNADLEARLASWPKPAFALLKNTWLGAIETDLFMPTTRTEGFGDGKVVTVKINKYLGMTLEDLADAYLFLGDLESLTASYPTPEMYKSDPDYLSEIQRRFGMMSGGRKFPVESLLQARKSNKFYSPPSKPPPPRSASNQDGPKVWAAISVSDTLFQERQTKDLMIHFTLVNGGTLAIDPKQETWRLFINGQELTDSGFIFGNGPRDARWKSLPPGDSLRFSYALERYFKEPGIYRVSWRGEGFETLPMEFRVMPSKKE
jgi:hypothetical protein